jgi:hypothetical protein
MATTAATAIQHQCSARMVRTPPPVAGIEATLVTDHWLLNNTPSVHASPSAAEQWHHDVNQLIIAAINTPYHEGGRQGPAAAHSHSPLTARASPSDHVPHQARILPTSTATNLHDELIRRRRGNDSRITIERHHERHRNIEDCNLKRDFESLTLAREAPAARAMRPPSSPAGSGGGGVWCLHHISEWWFGYSNSSLTYRRSMTGWPIALNLCRSTPPPSLL